ncbi:MAG: hypothetical protein KPEEDBHJ_01884 [Anaerolineales bacterium]|nr:hypothetical protein [Anaerolineales bacterium]
MQEHPVSHEALALLLASRDTGVSLSWTDSSERTPIAHPPRKDNDYR